MCVDTRCLVHDISKILSLNRLVRLLNLIQIPKSDDLFSFGLSCCGCEKFHNLLWKYCSLCPCMIEIIIIIIFFGSFFFYLLLYGLS